jgi:hypothetical protein
MRQSDLLQKKFTTGKRACLKLRPTGQIEFRSFPFLGFGIFLSGTVRGVERESHPLSIPYDLVDSLVALKIEN